MPTFFEIGQWGFQKDLKQILEKISQKREGFCLHKLYSKYECYRY